MISKKTACFVVVCMAFVSAKMFAASVLLDCFSLGGTAATLTAEGEYYLSWRIPDQFTGSIMPQYVDSGFKVMRSGANTQLTDYLHVPEFVGLWMQVAIGDIIDQMTFENAITVFSNGLAPFESGRVQTPISVSGNQNIYLAFVSYSVYLDTAAPTGYSIDKSNPYLGWVGLNVNRGTVSLIGSYVDLDGTPIIAGQYASAIPEPSSVLLLLVGGAVLGLRRRKRFTSSAPPRALPARS